MDKFKQVTKEEFDEFIARQLGDYEAVIGKDSIVGQHNIKIYRDAELNTLAKAEGIRNGKKWDFVYSIIVDEDVVEVKNDEEVEKTNRVGPNG